MEKLIKFVSEHISDDTSRLILNRCKWPDIDMDLAVSCIESRRKLKGKVNEWYNNPNLIFPAKLSAEQCSSSATALYKAILAERIAQLSGNGIWKMADLTGGLGVDSWFFASKASQVLYNEMQEALCNAARHNFNALGTTNIIVSNHAVISKNVQGIGTSPSTLLQDFQPDIIYMDPARRGDGGRKVFLIEECTPDVLTLKEELFEISRHILIKLSPMADISMACNRLGLCCREVHVVASGGECKELLIWMDREWNGEYEIVASELHNDGTTSEFRFMPSEEISYQNRDYPVSLNKEDCWLFEPGKAMMKAGAFNVTAARLGIGKLGRSTHYYITEDKETAKTLNNYGKVFRIKRVDSLNKRSIKDFGKEYPHAEITARNIPMDTETLRKKLGVTSGDDAHIFGLKSDSAGNLLIAAERI